MCNCHVRRWWKIWVKYMAPVEVKHGDTLSFCLSFQIVTKCPSRDKLMHHAFHMCVCLFLKSLLLKMAPKLSDEVLPGIP